MSATTPLASVLQEYLQERGFSLQHLTTASGIPKQTLHHWLEGSVQRPHTWQPVVKVARALGLKKAQVTTLLRAANHPSIDALLAQAVTDADKLLLSSWMVVAPHNLPSPLTTFIGRVAEISELLHLLGTARLVTLTGPGGCGKTRLSLKVAAELLNTFQDGVFFVDLSPITDPALVLSAIAHPLNVKEIANEPLIERLKTYVRPKHLLLLLDNFEHVVAAAPLVTDVLKAAPQLTVLVTSRVRLHVYGEHEFPVSPLRLPDPHETLAALTHNAAVLLFTERAQAANRDFALTTNNASLVADICRRLDGLPLAIELAAARSEQFTPQTLLDTFPSRLDLAQDGPRDVPQRHQALRRAIAWSYDLLSPGEQMLFRRLGVFIGGCTIRAAEAICSGGANLALTVSDGMASLVRTSLLRQGVGVGGEARLIMLETIREYALEQLTASGEGAEVERLHAHYYLRLAETATPALQGPEQALWLDRLEQEHANLRSALQWAIEQGEAATALRLGAALWPFWDKRGHWSEGRAWLERALALRGEALASLRAKVLSGAAALAHQQSDYAAAQAMYEESLALYTQVADQCGIAEALNNLGHVAQTTRQHKRASSLYEDSLRRFRALGDTRGTTLTLLGLAWISMFEGQYEQARAFGREGEGMSRELADPALIVSALTVLGLVAMHQGEYQQAHTRFEESLAFYRQLNEPRGISVTRMTQGYAALFEGNHEQAEACFQDSLVVCRDLQEKLTIAYCLDGLAGVAGYRKQPIRATRLAGAAQALRDSIGIAIPPSDRPHYDRLVTAIRAQLDEDAWETAWMEGYTMRLEQALDYAFAEAS